MAGRSGRAGWSVRPPYSSSRFSAPTYSIPKYLGELTNKYGNVPNGREIHDHSGGNKKMKRCLGILFALSLVFAPEAHGQVPITERTTGILKLVQTIPLPTQGYMDRIAVDVKGQRLFI